MLAEPTLTGPSRGHTHKERDVDGAYSVSLLQPLSRCAAVPEEEFALVVGEQSAIHSMEEFLPLFPTA